MNVPLDDWSGASAVKELEATIRTFNEQSSKYAETMQHLTIVIAILTALLFIGLVVQICISTSQS